MAEKDPLAAARCGPSRSSRLGRGGFSYRLPWSFLGVCRTVGESVSASLKNKKNVIGAFDTFCLNAFHTARVI